MAKLGEQVIERRIRVNEVLATVYHHLAINPAGLQFNDFSGRPIPVPADASPIAELVRA